MGLLRLPEPFDFELSTERFRAFGPDLANLWVDGALHRVVGKREVRIAPAPRGVRVEPLDAETRPVVRKLRRRASSSSTPFYEWAKGDPVLRELTVELAGFRPPLAPDPFETLVTSITAQQVSLHAAFAIRSRLVERFGRRVGPGVRVPDGAAAAARGAGRARRCSGSPGARRSTFSAWPTTLRRSTSSRPLPDEEIKAALVARRGLGEWTADWFLARHLARPRAWPAGDLALVKAVKAFYPEADDVRGFRRAPRSVPEPERALSADRIAVASRPLKLRALDAIADTFAPGSAAQGVPDAFLERLVVAAAALRAGAAVGVALALRGARVPPPASRAARADPARVGLEPGLAAPDRVPRPAEGSPAARLDASGRGLGRARLPGAARAGSGSARETARADRGQGRALVRRLRRRLGRGRRRGRRSAGGRGPRRRRPRGRGLPRAAGLRRRRAGRARADVPGRRHRGERRPGRRDPRGLVPRRRHRRQLHDLVPHARRRARGVGRAVRDRRLHAQPRRGLGAARGERRAQPRPCARGEAARRARAARLARRRHAPRRARLRAGARLRLLPVRLPARREAVQRPDLARRRREGRGQDRRRRARRADRFRARASKPAR